MAQSGEQHAGGDGVPAPVHEPGRAHGRFVDKPMTSGYLLHSMVERLRASDVIVNTLPKCGQTWLTALLMSIKLNGDLSNVNHFFEHVPWLEVTWVDSDFERIPLETRLEQMEAVTDPRIFKMHVDWEHLPIERRPDTKVITVTRDVRDLPFSFFNHLHSHDPRFFGAMGLPPPPPDFDTFFDVMFMARPVTGYIKQMWEHRNDSNVLVLRFEDMKKDLFSVARRVIDFLGWEPLSDEVLRERVLPPVHISNMKKILHTRLFPHVFLDGEKQNFIREGEVGRNRQHMSEAQAQKLRAVMEKDLPPEAVAYWYRETDEL